MSIFYKKFQNHINLNKEFKIILLLLVFLIIPKWIIPFLNGESDWLINTIIISLDTQYFPMIISLSEFEFAPSYLDFYQNNNLISVPFYSLFFHAIMFCLLGIKSFFILETILKLFFLFFFQIEKAYPISLIDTEKYRKLIISYLKKHHIFPIGLYGNWKYMWSDQSFYNGYDFNIFKGFKDLV